jgi:hypothetical protein
MNYFGEEMTRRVRETMEKARNELQALFPNDPEKESAGFEAPSVDFKGRESELKQRMPPEVLEAMNTPLGRMKILEWSESILTHYNNPLYGQASSWWLRVQGEQISKGISKYPTPLRAEDWTFAQFLEHAMQENVDQAHYLTALKAKASEFDKMALTLKKAEETISEVAAIAANPASELGEAVEAVTRYAAYKKELNDNVRMD